MVFPIYKINFTDFEKRVEVLRRPITENSATIANEPIKWYETFESIWLFFDKYYAQLNKEVIASRPDFDDVDDFKIKFLASALELVEMPIEFKRIEFLMEHYHYSHMHQGDIAPVEDAIALNPEKEKRIVVEPEVQENIAPLVEEEQ